ncbi:MAG: zf-HC2 domain-containing protein [Gemmatimonadaceae bacterium]
MTDCMNAEIRDLLPDYVNETLSASDAAIVQSHIAACVDCSDEIAILRSAVAVRPHITVDVAKIVASLPKSTNAQDPGIRSISSAPSVVRKGGAFQQWRGMAAAVVVLAAGVTAVAIGNKKRLELPVAVVGVSHPVLVADTPKIVASVPPSITTPVESATSARPASNARSVALSVGELSDFSDDEIEAVMKRLEKWDGATAADPLPGVPLLPGNSGGVR